MMTDDELLVAIRNRATASATRTDTATTSASDLHPVASKQVMHDAQRRLGFPLPEFLVRVYSQVSNGGFGPGYGLIGLPGGYRDGPLGSIVDVYENHRSEDLEDSAWRWPERLVRSVIGDVRFTPAWTAPRPKGPS